MKNPGNRSLSDYPEYVRAIVRVLIAGSEANREIGRISAQQFDDLNNAGVKVIDQAHSLFKNCGFYRANGRPSLDAVTQQLSQLSGVDPETVALNQRVVDTSATVAEIVVFDRLLELKASAHTLACALEDKAGEFKGIVKCGRIGLQDATPILLSTEISSYASSIREAIDSIDREQQKWNISHFGSGDLGTGYAIDTDFGELATSVLARLYKRPFVRPTEAYHALNQAGKFLSAHNALVELAFAIWRLANDLEFLSSGPRGGIRELILPAIAPGSSIMPGKINPTAAELAGATSDRVIADHDAMLSALHRSWGANGSLTGIPVKIMMENSDLLSRTCLVLTEKVIRGLTANPEKSQAQAENSIALGLILIRLLGRPKTQEIMNMALKEKLTVKQATLALNALPAEIADEVFDLSKISNLHGNRELMKKLFA